MTMLRLANRLANSVWLRGLTLAAVIGLAFVSLVPAAHSPPRTALPGAVEHFLAYFAVSGMAVFVFRRNLPVPILVTAMIAYAAILETAQRWAPGRSPALLDFVASAAGALIGALLCLVVLTLLARLDRAMHR